MKVHMHRKIALLILLLVTSSVSAQKSLTKDSIIVVGDITFRPFEFVNNENQADGIFVDLWKRWGELTNTKVIYKCYNWDEAQKLVWEGKADALGGAMKTPEREKKVEYIDILLTIYDYVYFNKNLIGYKDLNTISKQIKVGIVKGDIAVAFVKEHFPNVSIKEFANYESLVNSALKDSLFVFVMEPPVAKYYFINNDKFKTNFQQSSSYLMKEDLYGAIRKDRKHLIQKAKEGFKLLNSAEKNRVLKRWNYVVEDSWNEKYKYLIDNYPFLKYLLIPIISYLIVVCLWMLLYSLAPLYLFRTYLLISKHLSVKLEFKGISLQLSLDKLLLLNFFAFTNKVADSWLNRNVKLLSKIENINAFKERVIYTPTPIRIGDSVLDNSNTLKLESEIQKEVGKCLISNEILFICGEGGAGKTSFAIAVARWSISSISFLGHFSIPIFLDNDLTFKDSSEEILRKGLYEHIKNYCIWVFDDNVDDRWITYLLKINRIVLIIDGLSELNDVTKKCLNYFLEKHGSTNTIITSRNASESSSFKQSGVRISPLRLKGIYLSIFIENVLILKNERQQFTDTEFYDCCKYLAGISGKRDVTILFAALFVDLMVKHKKEENLSIQITSIPELVIQYIKGINKVATEKIRDNEIIPLLKNIAWLIIKNDLLPTPVRTEQIKKMLCNFSDLDKKIDYLIKKLNIINEFDSIIPKCKFSLDPISEYLAALYIIDDAVLGDGKSILVVKRFIELKKTSIESFIVENEFIQSYCDCCLQLDPSDYEIIVKNRFTAELLENYKTTLKNGLN